MDLRIGPNEPAVSPEAGRVVLVFESNRPADSRRFSRPAGWSGYGPRGALVESRSGVWHLLAHLDVIDVRQGDEVEEGQTIGRGSVVHHVHWEVRTAARTPSGLAVVESTLDPGAWLRGERVPWSGQCPEAPGNTRDTPRACRPSRRGEGSAPSAPRPPMAAPPSAAKEEGEHGRS